MSRSGTALLIFLHSYSVTHKHAQVFVTQSACNEVYGKSSFVPAATRGVSTSLSYGETPLVNCGPRSILLHCYYHSPFTRFIFILANYYLLPLDTLNPLFTANR
jgi:hypothetical protein